MFGEEGLKEKKFLDIGSGLGLFSLAALNLGVREVLAIDIDEDSVQTTQAVLDQFSPNKAYQCQKMSVFDLNPEELGKFDIVYSWGVLHHTGDMYAALKKGATMVKSQGHLLVALYKKTRFCEFWKKEKAFYTKAPKVLQKFVQLIYLSLFVVSYLIKKQNPFSYIKNYASSRGMSFSHDVHDWLGGYPYESISPEGMEDFSKEMKCKIIAQWLQPGGSGLLGSGCDEYLLQKYNKEI